MTKCGTGESDMINKANFVVENNGSSKGNELTPPPFPEKNVPQPHKKVPKKVSGTEAGKKSSEIMGRE